MRKLEQLEIGAVKFISHRGGSYCPGADIERADPLIRRTLNALVKKGRAYIENTDAGPRYHLTYQGIEDAEHG